jgi:hypothetical protein
MRRWSHYAGKTQLKPPMIKLSINVTRIPRESIIPGKNGKYVGLVCFDKPDTYGNDGFVALDVTKEEREAGKKGPIVGNWKHIGKKSAPPKQARPDYDENGLPTADAPW